MNESELKRVSDDLKIIKSAVGLGPPALGGAHVWGFLWLAFTGLLLMGVTLLPGPISYPWGGLLVLVCWIALPVRGVAARLIGKPDPNFEKAQSALPNFYALTVVGFGVAIFLWARLLGLKTPVTLGLLCFIEALPLLIISAAESWRRAGVGLALALAACGFGVPFVQGSGFGLLLGGAIFCGCLLSAAILYWQLGCCESVASAK